jgi:hypothetical protein
MTLYDSVLQNNKIGWEGAKFQIREIEWSVAAMKLTADSYNVLVLNWYAFKTYEKADV